MAIQFWSCVPRHLRAFYRWPHPQTFLISTGSAVPVWFALPVQSFSFFQSDTPPFLSDLLSLSARFLNVIHMFYKTKCPISTSHQTWHQIPFSLEAWVLLGPNPHFHLISQTPIPLRLSAWFLLTLLPFAFNPPPIKFLSEKKKSWFP
jgi:hypothetical protein